MLVVCAVVALALAALPARADTATDLETAKQQSSAARTELDRVARLWQDAEAQLAQAQDAARSATQRIGELEQQLIAVQERLNARAAEIYMAGGSQPALALITSASVSDAADRLQYASALAQQDTDLASNVAVQTQELDWQRQQLAGAIQQRASATASLQAQADAIRSKVAEYDARASDLQRRLTAEQATQQAPPPGAGSPPPASPGGTPAPVSGTGWLQTCPVNGATSFVDSFGDPRPGGRTHEGIDLIAAEGTPVVATHDGTVHHTTSGPGGYGTVLFHDGSADWTFYTHFSAYAGPGEGGHVTAGETIGLVGSTGDTTVNHLHFEYHPGGGGAVDPYSALLAVC